MRIFKAFLRHSHLIHTGFSFARRCVFLPMHRSLDIFAAFPAQVAEAIDLGGGRRDVLGGKGFVGRVIVAAVPTAHVARD